MLFLLEWSLIDLAFNVYTYSMDLGERGVDRRGVHIKRVFILTRSTLAASWQFRLLPTMACRTSTFLTLPSADTRWNADLCHARLLWLERAFDAFVLHE